MSIDKDFLEWFENASIYVGFDRHASFGGWGYVVAAIHHENAQLQQYVHDLDGDDIEALEASEEIKRMPGVWIGHDKDPVEAMQRMVSRAMEAHFYELNHTQRR